MWHDNLKLFELTEIMRQKDKAFAEMLNRMREAKHTPADSLFLNTIALTRAPPPLTVHCIFYTNADVDTFNQEALRALPGPESVSHADDTVEGPLTEKNMRGAHARLAKLPPKQTNKAMQTLRLNRHDRRGDCQL